MSSSNIRAGSITSAFISGSLTFSEVSTTDIGDTSQVTMSVGLDAGNVILSSGVNSTTGWIIKAKAEYL
jgi:hypothetical protein